MRNTILSLLAICLFTLSCSSPKPAAKAQPAQDLRFDRTFWSHWGDGMAEVAGYDLSYPRYGEIRPGVAVTIFVTETFSDSARVKADPGKHPPLDEFPVMKMNLIRDFQTGIYDYNTMLSSFVSLTATGGKPAGSATKLTFSSQEWCGQVWQQVLFGLRSAKFTMHSYFDGEADGQREIPYPKEGVSEDALMLWARGMARPELQPGESRMVQTLLAMQESRESHRQPAWLRTTLSRSAVSQTVTVPAGAFEVEAWTAEREDGLKRTFFVEKAFPHRIVRWETSAGEQAELLGAARLKYWRLNGKGGEQALKMLGLAPRPSRST